MAEEVKKPEKRDWEKIVKDNPTTLYFLPEKLLEETKAWMDKREELSKELNRVSRIEVETKVMLENLVQKIRLHLDEIGRDKVWMADIGFQTEALKEGKYVIAIEDK